MSGETETPKVWPRPWPDDRLYELHCDGLSIDGALQVKLRKVREQQMAEHRAGRPPVVCDIFYERNVVCLKVGMGRAAYLELNGRVWAENFGEGFPPEVLNDARDVASVIVRWSADIDLPDLVDLLPARPLNAMTCGVCEGSRLLPTSIMAHEDGRPLCCMRCYGLGWTFA